MSAILYSQTYTGQPLTVQTFTPATRADWVAAVKAALVAAGWSVDSGAGSDWVMGSATTPDNLHFKVRIWDPGAGNCARVGLRNWGNSLNHDSEAGYAFPGGLTWKIVASAYQFIVWVPSSVAARNWIMCGAPKIEQAQNFAFTDACFMLSNDDGDTNVAARPSLRTVLYQTGRSSLILNGALFGTSFGGTNSINMLRLKSQANYSGPSEGGYAWADGSLDVFEARIGYHPSTAATWIGYLWDSMMVFTPMTADAPRTWDAHNWVAVTSNNTVQGQYGTLMTRVD